MNERDVQGLIDRVKTGGLSRRKFVQRMVAVGLTAPMATQILMASGVAMAQSPPVYKPTKRGGGGVLKMLWWQGPTLLNPHFATGTKDQDASRLFYEPLAAWDNNGNLRAVLAASIPNREDGTLGADGKSVTWKLKQGVKWHDGKPFTADDVVFTWEYAKDPATAATTIGSFKDVTVEKVDDYTVKVSYAVPTPFWADAFVSYAGMIIPKHMFGDYTGAKSREAPANLKPIGTAAYKFKDFKPGDLVAGTINMDYHMPNRPYFDEVEMKGGGDAVSAARAVLQTGEYDFGWNLQVEDEILLRLEKGGKGKVVITPGGAIEHIQVNFADPNIEVDGEKASIKTKHPTLSDPRRCRC
jgi:peptide/nickel transport system substrate-binding protein